MAIIAVNRYYAPDHSATSQLLSDLAAHLAAEGEAVTVITSRLRYDDPNADLVAIEWLEGVCVRRVWTSRFGRYGLAGRAIDYLTFYVSGFLALLLLVRRGDTVLVKTDPPLMSVPAAMAARAKGAELVNWCQDLFPEIAAALGMGWAAGRPGRLLRALRNASMRGARVNVVLGHAMAERLAVEGIVPERVAIVENWLPVEIRPVARRRAADAPVTIVYPGNLGRVHAVERVRALIEAGAGLGIAWRIVGGGSGHARLKETLSPAAAGLVRFEAYAPLEDLERSLGEADVHLLALDLGCEGLVVPSKLYGILAAGRPVLHLGDPEGETARLLAESGAGITIDADEPAAFELELARLAARAGHLAVMGSRARALHEARFTRAAALARWRTVLTGQGASLDSAERQVA